MCVHNEGTCLYNNIIYVHTKTVMLMLILTPLTAVRWKTGDDYLENEEMFKNDTFLFARCLLRTSEGNSNWIIQYLQLA